MLFCCSFRKNSREVARSFVNWILQCLLCSKVRMVYSSKIYVISFCAKTLAASSRHMPQLLTSQCNSVSSTARWRLKFDSKALIMPQISYDWPHLGLADQKRKERNILHRCTRLSRVHLSSSSATLMWLIKCRLTFIFLFLCNQYHYIRVGYLSTFGITIVSRLSISLFVCNQKNFR